MIAAAGENNAIAKDGDLPWHLPDDFKRFQKIDFGPYNHYGQKNLR